MRVEGPNGWNGSRVVASSPRVLLIQPFVPSYRVPLFSLMKDQLRYQGVDFAVAAGLPQGRDASRADDCTRGAADYIIPQRTQRVLGRTVLIRDVERAMASFGPQWVIVEQAIKNVESWPLILNQRRFGHPRVAMWGQGRSFSTHQPALPARTKQWLTRRSDWFFAYTAEGQAHVVAQGFPSSRTTVLRNATDTATLTRLIAEITPGQLADFRQHHGLRPGSTGLFVGGVDERKGIGLLLQAAQLVRDRVPDFTLLVAGAGESVPEVEAARSRGIPVRALGRVEGTNKALAFAATDLVMVPEWIGLVAVDAIAAGKPVASTDHSSHSPEVEYLHESGTAVFSRHTARGYADAVVGMLADIDKWTRAAKEASISSRLSIEDMAARFSQGIVHWLGAVAAEL